MPSTHEIPAKQTPNTHADSGGERAQRDHQSESLDEALMESFPASDPIAISVTCIARRAITKGSAPINRQRIRGHEKR